MTNDELIEILNRSLSWTPEVIWQNILSKPQEEWVGDANWECKTEHRNAFDIFLQKAFSSLPSPPPLDYVDSLTSNYELSIVDAPDAENKAIRAYEECYKKMLESISESIKISVIPLAESPDSDVEVSEVLAELERFKSTIKSPRFLS